MVLSLGMDLKIIFFNKKYNLVLNIKDHDKNIFFSTYYNKSILIINYDISSDGGAVE